MPDRNFIEFPREHVRITPPSEQALRALEPIQIARLIKRVREETWLYRQIRSKHYKWVLRRVDSIDFDDFHVRTELLHGWLEFLTQVLLPRENGYFAYWGAQRAQMQTDKAQLVRELQASSNVLELYLYRAVNSDLLAKVSDEGDVALCLDELSVNELREAKRWCVMYVTLTQAEYFAQYMQDAGIKQQDIDNASYLELASHFESLSDYSERQTLVEVIITNHPQWREILLDDPDYKLHAEKIDLYMQSTDSLLRILEILDTRERVEELFDADGNFATS